MDTSFIARYHGTCSDCLEDIQPGEEIYSDGYGGFEHVHCRPALEDRVPKTCPECWLTMPCEHTE